MKQNPSKEKWLNPGIREENSHLDFSQSKVIYFAEHLGTVLDSDITIGYLKKRYRDKAHVTLWELNTFTGIKQELSNLI